MRLARSSAMLKIAVFVSTPSQSSTSVSRRRPSCYRYSFGHHDRWRNQRASIELRENVNKWPSRGRGTTMTWHVGGRRLMKVGVQSCRFSISRRNRAFNHSSAFMASACRAARAMAREWGMMLKNLIKQSLRRCRLGGCRRRVLTRRGVE